MKLITLLTGCGLNVSTDGDNLIVSPADGLTDTLRELIRDNKAQLLADVRNAERATTDVIAAINACCDARGDSDANRDALIACAEGFTPDQQRELAEHFNEQAAIWSAATGRGGA